MDINKADILSLMESDDRFRYKIESIKATFGAKLDALSGDSTTIDGTANSDEQEIKDDISKTADNSDLTMKYLKELTGIEKAKNQKNKFFDDMSGSKDTKSNKDSGIMGQLREMTGIKDSKGGLAKKLMGALAIIGILHEFGTSLPNIGRVIVKLSKSKRAFGTFFAGFTKFIDNFRDMKKLNLMKALKGFKFADIGKPFIRLIDWVKDIKNFKISSIFKAIKLGKNGGRLASKSNPITAILGEIVFTIMDGIMGFFNADKWGVGKINGVISSVLATSDKGVMGAFGNFGKWALIGAGIGSVVPVLGTAVGGLIGGILGAVLGFIGGERIAKFFNTIGGAISKWWTETWTMVSDYWGGLWTDLSTSISSSFISSKEWVSDMTNTIKTKFAEIKDNIIERITKVFDDIKASIASIIPKKPKWVADLQKKFGGDDSTEPTSGSQTPYKSPDSIIREATLRGLSNAQKAADKQNAQLLKQNEELKLAVINMTEVLSGDLKTLPNGIADKIPEGKGDTFNTVNSSSIFQQGSTNIPDYRNTYLQGN